MGKEGPSMVVCGVKVPMKVVSLAALVFQTTAVVITMRYSRMVKTDGPRYLNTSAVVSSEILKLVASVVLVWQENSFQVDRLVRLFRTEVFAKPMTTLKVGIPALLYTIQNNLLFVALSHLSGAMYQVTYQLKILTTALLSVMILHKQLSLLKWLSLIVLTAGVALIQIPPSSNNAVKPDTFGGSTAIGLAAVLAACFTSGLAGVLLERILKGAKVSIWVRNIQLALFGAMMGLAGCLVYDGAAVARDGFFQGYNGLVWTVILLQALGGMVVAAVLKYADNILKCFGNATSIALSCLLSYHLIGDFTPSLFYVVGTSLVIVAMYLYSGKDDVPMAGAEGGRRRVRLPASLRRFLRRLLLGKKPGGSAARPQSYLPMTSVESKSPPPKVLEPSNLNAVPPIGTTRAAINGTHTTTSHPSSFTPPPQMDTSLTSSTHSTVSSASSYQYHGGQRDSADSAIRGRGDESASGGLQAQQQQQETSVLPSGSPSSSFPKSSSYYVPPWIASRPHQI
ncbi:unnamed protein product [Vitrella brassicaformis CCMP3155]|uniref:UDP-N-acetylglucosamine transporter n=2 Tax=Vitrella brassicaformis TaxID=1169539 RepID=A0A0G4EQA4_VITBC|nr:unnamed protein product [Vitrella brassicaformis CCMP3155]|mmetsp:Transcript_54097/g.136121  ORF Transcript_54097/g.136121 Transcript_54097/m.136121 type:complete len:510 (+) Transcript_54097:46-1575(+)|eukprot:CEL99631.1 unnamed protein product [Vitrella brassicaformis CCMP3155]